MRKILVLLLALLCIGAIGCSTRGTIATKDKSGILKPYGTFTCVEVKDATGYVWGDDEDKLDLAKELKWAIDAELASKQMLGRDYKIKTIITKYEPGNAFKRALMPGFGSTELNTKSEIFGKRNALVATVPVERYIGFGGVFTIGAWRSVCKDVAKELVKVLMQSTGRKVKQEQEKQNSET